MNAAFPPAAPAPMALRCPKCAADMTTYERSGIVVDQCRECRGIFLDRGELERLVDIESGTGWTGPRMTAPPPVDPRTLDPRYADSRPAGPPFADPRHGDPRYGDPRYGDPRQPGGAQPPASRDSSSAAYRPDWHGWDDDDRDDRRRDGRGAKPQKRRSILGELLEGLGD